MSMFWGLPVMVATLPILDEVATASRNGKAGSRSLWVRVRTKGTITRHTMSFTKKAESTPQVRMTAGSSISGLTCRRTSSAFHSKNPESRSAPTTSIMANSSTMVLKSTSRSAPPAGTTRKTTMAMAPIMAAPVRSILRPGNLPNAKTK